MNYITAIVYVLMVGVTQAENPSSTLRLCPVDTVVATGQTVRLRCAVSEKDDSVRWYRGNESEPDAKCIYNKRGMFKQNVDVNRFRVNTDNVESALIITDSRPEDAGVYMCTGLPSNSRGIAKLDIVEYLTSTTTFSIQSVIRQCVLKYSGLLKPNVEWLDAHGKLVDVEFNTSTDKNGIVSTSTDDPSATQCRFSFPRSSCRIPHEPFKFGEENLKRISGADLNKAVETTSSWNWKWACVITLIVAPVLIVIIVTVVVWLWYCVHRSLRRATNVKHNIAAGHGFSNAMLNADGSSIVDVSKKSLSRSTLSGRNFSIDSGLGNATEVSATNNEYEHLKNEEYTRLNVPVQADNNDNIYNNAVTGGTIPE